MWLVVDGDVEMYFPSSPREATPSPPGKITTCVDSSNGSWPSPRPTDGGDSASSFPLWNETEAVLVCRELGISNSAIHVDSARASEKYVPNWSIANKDRVVDALSAKISLFHIGTPIEHLHYRKMSGSELGNALIWVEAESNYRRFERDVATLKKQEGMHAKVKQEITLLHDSISRLKEQVLETKEVSKAFQASAATAYEARYKVVQELEVVNLKFNET
ncbi:hypothetical protein Hanom_Chr15g01368161 [Helianthus anomalus]